MRFFVLLLVLVITFSTLYWPRRSCALISQLDENKAITVDGKRFFAIGIYSIPKSSEPFKELAEAGFNLVRCDSKDELDGANKYGIKAWIPLGDRLDFSKETEDRKTWVKSHINSLKDHPALLAWESMDEPTWTWKNPSKARASADGLAQGHKFAKELDPSHLLWINHAPRNTHKTLAIFSQNADVIACDVYPVISRDIDADKTYAIMPNGKQTDLANQTISCVGEYVNKLRKTAAGKQAIWIVEQGFAWDNEQNPKNPLYPTYREMRFMAYNAIMHGVDGILYWGTHSMPQPSEQWSNLKKVARELADLSDVILSPNINNNVTMDYEEMGFSIDSGVEVMFKKYKDAIYMFAANTTVGPAKVAFSNLPFSEGFLDVLSESRRLNVSENSFQDMFEPYGVHIYKIANR